jgi:hypothetical protein
MNFCKFRSWEVLAIIFSTTIVDGIVPFDSYKVVHYLLHSLTIFSYLKWIYDIAQLLYIQQIFAKKNSWRFFQFNFIYFIVYIVIIYVLQEYNSIQYSDIAFRLLIFHLYASFAIVYFLYVIARNFMCIQLKKDASLSEYIAAFFAVWFLPIGIWWIQPKIREMAG